MWAHAAWMFHQSCAKLKTLTSISFKDHHIIVLSRVLNYEPAWGAKLLSYLGHQHFGPAMLVLSIDLKSTLWLSGL
jgi:hypothetical protein